MTIDFGSIKSYNPDRGFGFVGHTFSDPNGKVFFHIRKIKNKHPELAQKLDNSETFETVNFWYEIETTEKGEQVSKFWLKAENIPQSYTDELSGLIQKVESIWKNVDSPKHSWLDLVTIELVGVDRRQELSVERDNLESQLREAEEERRRAAEALRENEIGRIAKCYDLTKTEADELEQLLAEMRPLEFTHSKQLSKYIKNHRLGYRYPNISGIVRMEKDDTEWDFHGGFPPDIYKVICRELDLDNQGTRVNLLEFVDGMIELSDQYENVTAENLVQVSREEVQRALRGFYLSGLLSRITVNPRQCGGRPCIRGMRIRVSDVLDLFAAGLSAGEILEEMPDLEADDLKASLLYASRKLNHPVLVA